MARALNQFKLFCTDQIYFVDSTLGQLRNVNNPHDLVLFPSTIDLILWLTTTVRCNAGEYLLSNEEVTPCPVLN